MFVSSCCKGDMYVYTTGEGTSFYVCRTCEHGCDGVNKQDRDVQQHVDIFNSSRLHDEE